jgi:electron transport complex protein RnfG
MAGKLASAIGTVLLVGAVAAAAAFLVSSSFEWTRERIAANERARVLESLQSVLDPRLRGQDLVTVQLTVTDEALLGSAQPTDVFIATENDRPAAAVFASVAPDGYNAEIRLLVGVSAEGVVTGVRSVAHRETPGLGDAIDTRKSDWVRQFDGKSLAAPPADSWLVDKDEGAFDSITGATITSRAVVEAVKNALLYFDAHRAELFTAAMNAPPEDAAAD